jgi:membrane protein YdbS with pleckstrin-like domain
MKITLPIISSISRYFKITRNIFYILVLLISMSMLIPFMPFMSFAGQIFVIIFLILQSLCIFAYLIRLWRYQVVLTQQCLLIQGLFQTRIEYSDIDGFYERMVNGFSHLHIRTKSSQHKYIKLYEYLDQYDQIKTFLRKNFEYKYKH